MDNYFDKVKNYLIELEYNIMSEDKEDGILIIEREDDGIQNMIIACNDSIVVLEQFLFDMKVDNLEIYKSLLMKNRDIIHGAFVLGEDGKKILFRDTLQIENLDLNEIESSLNSLSMLLTEFSEEIIRYATM